MSAASPSLVINALDSSTRVTWPCAPSRSTSEETAAQVGVHQFGIVLRHEIGQWPADHVIGPEAQQRQEAWVGEDDLAAMHEHGMVHGFDQTLEQLFAAAQMRAALLQILQEAVHRRAELAQRRRRSVGADAPEAARLTRAGGLELQAPYVLVEFRDRPLLAPPRNGQCAQSHAQYDGGQQEHRCGYQGQARPRLGGCVSEGTRANAGTSP
jgi:hypothetical protein